MNSKSLDKKEHAQLDLIRRLIQVDVAQRGLARDPGDNLLTATSGQFEAACQSLASSNARSLRIYTGFCVPTADPPAFETDGPLGAFFLERAFRALGVSVELIAERPIIRAIEAARFWLGYSPSEIRLPFSHEIWIERSGPASDGRHYSMRGRDVTLWHDPELSKLRPGRGGEITIGIGDGGNEIGMGRLSPATIYKNVPHGNLIHCQVPTDYLIIAGVSNWAAYGLAAGVYFLRGLNPPRELYDPNLELEILQILVREGPLVDGVTGRMTATVDGLNWDQYIQPILQIRDILET